MILPHSFYQDTALDLAPKLLGKLLCRNINGNIIKLPITETECYLGEIDTACHAHKGKTPRTQTMYLEGGCTYIYLCYGIHSLLNIVTGKENSPEAVLIRGIEGFNGPGKLTKYLGITKELNAHTLYNSKTIWLEDSQNTQNFIATPRIGIGYATKEYQEKLWRFVVTN